MVDSIAHQALAALKSGSTPPHLGVYPWDADDIVAACLSTVQLADDFRNAPVVFIEPPFSSFHHEELFDTGFEFYQADILPYPATRFIIESRTFLKGGSERRFCILVTVDDSEDMRLNLILKEVDFSDTEWFLIPYSCQLIRTGPKSGIGVLGSYKGPKQEKVRADIEALLNAKYDLACRDLDRELVNASTCVLAGLTLLTTREANVEHHPAPEKLNKKRRAKGRFEIPEKQHVRLRTHETVGGPVDFNAAPHASPRPHWRRGHVRRYQDGRVTRVSPTIVGVDTAFREEAKARMPAPEYRIG